MTGATPVGTVYGPDLSNHNSSVDFAALDALPDVHLVTHKITEGVGWTDPLVAQRAASLQRFAAPGFYHVLWPTNSQDNPQNQAKWFVDEVVRVAPWMVRHRCPVLQGDFELFSNFVPYRAPTIIECNRWMSWVAHYWAQAGGNPPAIVAYAPYWLYGTAVTGLDAPWWASSYVPGSGNYHNLYPGNDAARWEQVPGHPAVILQYTDAATFPGAAAGVDANAVRGVSTAAELQALLIGGTPVTDEEIQAIAQAVWARGLTYPGGLTIAAGTRLATVDHNTNNLTTATSGNVWDENIAGPGGTVVDSARDRLGKISHNVGIDLPGQILATGATTTNAIQTELDDVKTQLAAITDALAALSRQIAAIPTGGPTSFTMTGRLEPEPPPAA